MMEKKFAPKKKTPKHARFKKKGTHREAVRKTVHLFQACFARAIFIIHSVICVWRVVVVKNDPIFWYLLLSIWLIIVEGCFTIIKLQGNELNRFTISVFPYILSVVPSICILEMDQTLYLLRNSNKATWLKNQASERNFRTPFSKGFGASSYASASDATSLQNSLKIDSFENLFELRISRYHWVLAIEQGFVFILIIAKWFLPRGKLSRVELSELLLVYIGTAADLMEFFELFKEEVIRYNILLCKIIMICWVWSLIQFGFSFTSASRNRRNLSTVSQHVKITRKQHLFEISTILINLIFQDVPFLTVRLFILKNYGALSVMNIFFTSKNILLILIELYRMLMLYGKLRKQVKRIRKMSSARGMKAVQLWNLLAEIQ